MVGRAKGRKKQADRVNIDITKVKPQSSITRNQILEIMTPIHNVQQSRRISFSDYILRRNFLTQRLEHIMATIMTSYASQLPAFFDKITRVTPAITLLSRRSGMLRTYMIDLYSVLVCMQYINANIDNSIEYSDVSYDSPSIIEDEPDIDGIEYAWQ